MLTPFSLASLPAPVTSTLSSVSDVTFLAFRPFCTPPEITTRVRVATLTCCRSTPAAQFVLVPLIRSPHVPAVPRLAVPFPVKFMSVSVMFLAPVFAEVEIPKRAPCCVQLEIVPPEFAAPVPLTAKLPLWLLTSIPFAEQVAMLMLLNVTDESVFAAFASPTTCTPVPPFGVLRVVGPNWYVPRWVDGREMPSLELPLSVTVARLQLQFTVPEISNTRRPAPAEVIVPPVMVTSVPLPRSLSTKPSSMFEVVSVALVIVRSTALPVPSSVMAS